MNIIRQGFPKNKFSRGMGKMPVLVYIYRAGKMPTLQELSINSAMLDYLLGYAF
ncbi:hypothetical protein NSMS1_39000 [Nostoc sp. MS1]|nr:hypothetical protein NSMS1_39000 [Nostoc sp. MS1]